MIIGGVKYFARRQLFKGASFRGKVQNKGVLAELKGVTSGIP